MKGTLQMKNCISIKKQMVLLFIPYINFSIMFIWYFLNLKRIDGIKYFREAIKSFIILCLLGLLAIPISIINGYLQDYNSALAPIVEMLLFYCFSVILMGSLVVYQVRLLKKANEI